MDKGMDKKKVIIAISGLVIVTTIIVSGILSITNSSNNGTKSDDGTYYIEKGINKTLAQSASEAAVNYVNLSEFESKSNRLDRLREIFTNDSPVFENSLPDMEPEINDVSSKVTSVSDCDVDSDYPCLYVTLDVSYKTKSDVYTASKQYWVTLHKNDKGVYKPYDIGEETL